MSTIFSSGAPGKVEGKEVNHIHSGAGEVGREGASHLSYRAPALLSVSCELVLNLALAPS